MHQAKRLPTDNLLTFPLPDLALVKVEAGSFTMGEEASGWNREKPAHPVHIKNPFYIGRFQVTQRLYAEVMKNNPSRFQGNRRPVEKVSWNDTKKFIIALEGMKAIKDFKKENGYTNYQFRLPTEAEWEFAARGGMSSRL